MIDYEYSKLYTEDSTDKQMSIKADGIVLTNEDLYNQELTLEERLCSEDELRFGCCEASTISFKIGNIAKQLIGEWIDVSIVLNHHDDAPMSIGSYKVASDKPTADRKHREVVAYDAMHDIINADVAGWYNSVLPEEGSTMSMKELRESFIRHFGLEEIVPEGGLVNDGMIVERTIDPEQMSGKDVITAICEINACFGHIGRDGKFHYIYLPQVIGGLYPADDLYPSDTLFPKDPKGARIGGGTYISIEYEDYSTQGITKLQIRQEENDIGKIWPETPLSPDDNCYIIQGNFLVYGKSSDQLRGIAENILGKIIGISYNPLAKCEAIGNPCLEVGDPIRMSTKFRLIETYILERTLKGIQALRDTYKASGVEKYAEKVNGVHASIIQLKGKANILERTIEETRLAMIDMGAGLSTEITVTAGQIRAELQNTKEGLETEISVTAGQIRAELKNTADGLETTIETTAAGIRADVAKTYETKTDASSEYTSIRSSISVEAGRITSEINRATKAEQTLSGQIVSTSTELTSKIEQTEASINLSVDKKVQETKNYTDNSLKNYSTTTQMNAAIKLSADNITSTVSTTYETKTNASSQYTKLSSSITQTSNSITAEVTRATNAESALSSRITITENGITTKVSKGDISSEISQEAGKISIKSNRISIDSTYFKLTESGEITATGGKIANFDISATAIRNGKTSLLSSAKGVYIGTDGISVGGNGYGMAAFSVTADGEVTLYSRSGGIEIKSNDAIDFYPTSGDVNIKYRGVNAIEFTGTSSSTAKAKFYAAYTILGQVSGRIGFFGSDGSAKKTVAKASTSSTVAASAVATVVNNLIDALKAYNLIG